MRSARIVAAAIAIGIFSPLTAFAKTPPAPILNEIGIDQNLNQQIPLDLSFQDETGRTVSLRQYFGKKPVILAFVYYECPMLCTLTLNGLVRSLRAIPFDAGRDFEVVVVSFDPHETWKLAAAKKQTYLEEYRRPGTEYGWHFLTGGAEEIHQLTGAAGFRYKFDSQSQQWAHTAGILALTPEGRISRYFYGVEFPTRDLRLSLVEASDHRIGALSDKVLLYCYQYDPVTGKYGFAIIGLLRIAGIATVLALAIYIVGMVRREHGAPHAVKRWS